MQLMARAELGAQAVTQEDDLTGRILGASLGHGVGDVRDLVVVAPVDIACGDWESSVEAAAGERDSSQPRSVNASTRGA